VNLAALGGSNTWKRAAAQLTNAELASGATPELQLSGTSGGSPTDNHRRAVPDHRSRSVGHARRGRDERPADAERGATTPPG